MTPGERIRLIWTLITANDSAFIAERIHQVPTNELLKTGEGIVRNTMAVLEGIQSVQTGMLDELARQTEAINELSSRITSVEHGQSDAATDRAANMQAIKVHLAAIDERLAKGDKRFDYLDAIVEAHYRPTKSQRGE